MKTAGEALVLGLVCGSLLLWGLLLRRRGVGKPLFADNAAATSPSTIAFGLAAVWMALRLGASLLAPDRPLGFDPQQTLTAVKINCLPTLLVWGLLAALLYRPGARWELASSNLTSALYYGGATFLASFFPVLMVLLASQPLRDEAELHPLLRLLHEQPSVEAWSWVILAAVVLAPLYEELVFRVILQGWLTARVSPRLAIVAVALLFAVIHGWPDLLALLPLALILGYVYHCRRDYLTNVTAHALFNASNLLLQFLSDD